MTLNVARKNELGPEDIARGERMKALRLHWGLLQRNIVPGNHTQASNVEAGKNKLQGPLLLQYSDAFGADPHDMLDYANGDLDLATFVSRSTLKPGELRARQGPEIMVERGGHRGWTAKRIEALAVLVDRHQLKLMEANRALDAVEAFDRASTAEAEHWAVLALKVHASIRGTAIERVVTEEFGSVGSRSAAKKKKR